jgi:DNA invertase Pin-like site-specific DNA recombinase
MKRAAIYIRASTNGQTTENQRGELETIAAQRGWQVVATYEDAGISGAKGREKRPAFDRMLKDATAGKFDMVMAWSVDRLGRSLQDLISFLSELHATGRDLYLHQQAIDTTTPLGRHVSDARCIRRVRAQYDPRAGECWPCEGQDEWREARPAARSAEDRTAHPRPASAGHGTYQDRS